MAHFAELNISNEVLRIVKVANEAILDEDGNEQESLGLTLLDNLYGGIWVQTSYNSTFRKHYARIGWKYDSSRNAFLPPQPSYSSWILNETTCIWEPPVAYPEDGNDYTWNEDTISWDLV